MAKQQLVGGKTCYNYDMSQKGTNRENFIERTLFREKTPLRRGTLKRCRNYDTIGWRQNML